MRLIKRFSKIITIEGIVRCFHVMFCFFPFGMAAVLGLAYFTGTREAVFAAHGNAYYFLPEMTHRLFAGFTCVLFFVFLGKGKVPHRNKEGILEENTRMINPGAIFLLAFGIRFALLYVFRHDVIPFSDFSRAWSLAHDESEFVPYYLISPGYLNYSSYMNVIIRAFGDSFVYVLYLNAICSGLTSVIIYYIVKEIEKTVSGESDGDERFAVTAAFMYVFMPAEILYCFVATPEYITILFCAAAVLVILKAFGKLNVYWYSTCAGFLLGIANAFKTFGQIIVIAFCMVFPICMMRKGEEKRKYHAVKVCCLSVAAVILCSTLSGKAILRYTENREVMPAPLSGIGGSIPHFMLVGLNTQGEGQIHIGELSRRYWNAIVDGMGIDDAKSLAWDTLREDWKDNSAEILKLFPNKMIWAWQDHMVPIHYFLNSVGLKQDTAIKSTILEVVREYLPSINQLYYILLMLLGMIGTLPTHKEKRINLKMSFCLLIVFGYFGMVLLSEAQSRYKCLVLPYICIAAANGLRVMEKDE